MLLTTNPNWNEGSIITPEKMNQIELAIEKLNTNFFNKITTFDESDGSIREQIGEPLIFGGRLTEYYNKKEVSFESDGTIKEIYTIYFKPGENDETKLKYKIYEKTISFANNNVEETVGLKEEGEITE